jgi:hypothetical protein
LYFTVGLERLYKNPKKYRCVPNVIHICTSANIEIFFLVQYSNNIYYIRLYFTVFLLARSNTRDIPFSNILISKKQCLCNNIELLHEYWWILSRALYSLLYCSKFFRKNILIFALVQYEWHSERTGIFIVINIYLFNPL